MKTIIFTAIYLAGINIVCADNQNLDFALQELQKACDMSKAASQKSEAIELARYCLTSGEVIALQAAESPEQRHYAKTIVAGWIAGLAKQVAVQ